MWKREQAYVAGPIAASNVIWAEAGKRLFFSQSHAKTEGVAWGTPLTPPLPHWRWEQVS